jgi:uncharacterized protein YukE
VRRSNLTKVVSSRPALMTAAALAVSVCLFVPAAASAQNVKAFGISAAWASPDATPPGPSLDWLPAVKTRGMNSNRIAGMSWRRLTVNGKACPAWPSSRHTCTSRWQHLDDALAAHHREGMAPTVVLADSRANSGSDTKVTGSEVEVYAEVMKQLTDRYTWCGTFCLIDAIQVWNEPNSAGFGGYTVAEYRTLFLATVDAIASVQPKMRVISGAPAPTVKGWRNYQRDIAKFPGEFILGAHVYPIDAEPIVDAARDQYNVSRNAVDENGNARPVRVTEVGVCAGGPAVTCPNSQVYEIDEAQQAEELSRVCKMLANRGAEGIMIYAMLASRPGGVQSGFGLRNDAVDEPYLRPAWEAITDCHLGWSAPANTSPPEISGTAREGETLTVSRGTWSGDGSITYTYQWHRCDTAGESCADISAATGATYELAGADVGHTLRATVTAQNAWGAASERSEATALVAALPGAPASPANTSPPEISGTAREGETLTVSRGTWSGDGSITYTYQWHRCDTAGESCADISAATRATYELADADVGHRLRATVTAQNAWGAASARSEPTALVAAQRSPSRRR